MEQAPRCPTCEKDLPIPAIVRAPEEVPEPGDFLVCLFCTSVAVFTDTLAIRPVNVADTRGERLDVFRRAEAFAVKRRRLLRHTSKRPNAVAE